MMIKELIVLLSSFAILYSSSMQNSQSAQSQMRDLTLYEKAGPYAIGFGLHEGSPEKMLAEIRMFLWNHWKQHQLGYLLATFYSKEGEPSKNEFFVESDTKGHWQITVETGRVLSSRRPRDKRLYRENIKSMYDRVERIEPPKDGLSSPILIRDSDVRESHTYRLRLTDRRTNEEIVL